MTSSPSSAPKTLFEHVPTPVRRLIVLTLVCGILLVLPFFRPQMETPGFGLLAVALLLPYLVVCWKLLRAPESKEGPGLAAGIGALFSFMAALGLAVSVEEISAAHVVYFAALGLAHALLTGLGFAAFREGASQKPAWRVAVRSVVDPVVYYGIVFFLALAGLGRAG